MNYANELSELIQLVVKEGASDLHLSAGYHPTMRVSGSLLSIVKKPVLSGDDTCKLMEELIPPDKQKRFHDEKEIDFSYEYEKGVRFRGNCFFSKGNVSIALRLVPTDIRGLSDLGLPDILKDFATRRQGFFLVVGPVGHGKSTTLAAMIELINTEFARRIVTIEDPIEYVYQPKKSVIDQREVSIDTNDFKTALTATFRQDIDVILIGEMRGLETISAAVTAAETGHLVFSTLHTNNAAQTIDRIIDSFPPHQQDQIRLQLASSLVGIFSQRLVPRVSGGRIPAYELLINNNAVANLIRERRSHELNSMIETGVEHGMIDMNRTLAGLVRGGVVTLDEAERFSLNPKVLAKII